MRLAEIRLATETERRMEAERLTRQMEDRLREAERVANTLQGSSLEQRDEAFWMVERGGDPADTAGAGQGGLGSGEGGRVPRGGRKVSSFHHNL